MPCAGTMSLGTAEVLEAMWHIPAHGVLFTMGFAELLPSTLVVSGPMEP